jgi:hypothetical protein
MHAQRPSGAWILPRLSALCAAGGILLVPGCTDDATAPRETPQHVNAIALVEIQFNGIGTGHMSTAARVLPIARAASWAGAAGAQFDLSVPVNSDGSTDTTIQLDPHLVTAITYNGWLYLQSVYRVRNASHLTGSAFDTPRDNLTFMAVETPGTIPGTPVLGFRRADGSPLDVALAHRVLPTGSSFADAGALVSLHPDVLQTITEEEVSAIHAPQAVVTNIFPYGFVVRRTGSQQTRRLGASPDQDTFQGIVNFGIRIPLQSDPSQNPSSLSIMVLALDDTETRLTQSLEEQQAAARRASLERASSLRAAPTLLPGGTLPWYGGYRTLCTVRTAGTAAAPLAYLVNVTSRFAAVAPDPGAGDGSGSFIDRAAQLRMTFTQPVTGAGPTTLRVRGLQSGPAFGSATYTGNGTVTVSTPPGSFVAGEVVEFVATTALTCPAPHAGRLRVATVGGTGQFESARVIAIREEPSGAVTGDVNNDDILDAIITNTRSNSVSVLVGRGDGTFHSERTYAAGPQPQKVELADLNDDGALDIVVMNPGTVTLLLGNGDGTLGLRTASPRAGTLVDLAIADINADGLLDVLAAHQQGHITLALGNGDGTFVDAATFGAARRATALVTADFNGDGNLDVVVTDEAEDGIAMLPGNGDGTFQAPRASAGCEAPVTIDEADFNRDGILDVVVANGSAAHVCVMSGRSGGGFDAPRIVATGAADAHGIAIGDIDASGSLDLVVAHAAGEIRALTGNGDGTFGLSRPIGAPAASSPVLADLDADGSLDLLLINIETAQLPGGGSSGSMSVLRAVR